MGISKSDLVDVIPLHPILISLKVQNALLPKLKAWESLFGSRETLLKNLRRSSWFLSDSIDNASLDSLRAEEIGILWGSRMFIWILDVLHGVSREKFETQVKLMNTFG